MVVGEIIAEQPQIALHFVPVAQDDKVWGERSEE